MLAKTRQLEKRLVELHARPRGRLVVLTGARQVGKSTLAGMAFPGYPVVNFDSPLERDVYARWTPAQWIAAYPRAVLDEAQKLPAVFETVKACYDRDPDVRYVLLGSSQILLLRRVRETLAGRVALLELFPFTLPELVAEPGVEPAESCLLRLVRADDPAGEAQRLFAPDLALRRGHARAVAAWLSFLRFGGMPPVHAPGWSDDDRFEWLRDYQDTYLRRDLADIARLDRLEPFVRAQKAAALRTAQRINFSELARLSGVSPPTAREFLRYLEISYQVFLLPAWFRNPGKRLTKQPKLHFLDPGVRRALLGRRGEPDGAEFESCVVAEVAKQCRTARLPLELSHLRTADGREVDLLLEREDGFVAIECKQAERVARSDARHLRGLEAILDKPLLLGIVCSNGLEVGPLPGSGPPLWQVPAAALLSGTD